MDSPSQTVHPGTSPPIHSPGIPRQVPFCSGTGRPRVENRGEEREGTEAAQSPSLLSSLEREDLTLDWLGSSEGTRGHREGEGLKEVFLGE